MILASRASYCAASLLLLILGLLASPRALSEGSRDPALLRERAAAALRHGQAEEAAALYAELLKEHPQDELAMAGRVRALLAGDLWRQALQEARRFSSAFPAAGEIGVALGEALYRGGHLREAASLLEPFAATDRVPPRALLYLGLVRAAEGRVEEALDMLDRAMAADPEDRQILFWAAGAAPTNARAVELLLAYLARSDGDDPDRIEAVRGSLAFYRALGERKLWVPVSRPERLEVPLRPLGNPRAGVLGYMVDVSLGSGKPVRLLLDTGSTGLFLLERIARRHGFSPLAEATTFGGGGDRRHPTGRGLLPSFALGDLRFADALASTTTTEMDPTGRYHGVIGLSVFDGYRVTLDLGRERLLLEPPAEQPLGEPYWTVSSQLLVEASVEPEGRGLFLFDTGAVSSLVSLSLVGENPAAKTGGPAALRGFGGGIRDARQVRGLRLRYQGLASSADRLIAADLTLPSRLGGVEVSGFLGLDLLDGSRVVIDTRSRRLLVTRHEKR